MSVSLTLAILVLLGQPDPLATARRLMLEGDLSTAIPVLESVVDSDSPDRTRAGFLLEVTRQLLEAYSPHGLALLTPDAEENLAMTDTMSVDGELMLLSGRLDQLNTGTDSPFPMIRPVDEDAWSIVFAESDQVGSAGFVTTEFHLGPRTVSPGDTLRIWMPLACSGPGQDAGQPSWDASGLRIIESLVSEGDDVLPVLYIMGVVSSEEGISAVTEQSFTIGAVTVPSPDPLSVVLPVPGSSPYVDRNLASTDWIDASAQAFITAREVTGSEPNPVYKVDSVMLFLLDSFRVCQVPVGPVLIEGLSRSAGRTHIGDSSGISALFAALCRALGVPARVVAGYIDTPSGPVYHCFTELMFEPGTWVGIDLVLADVELDFADSRLPSVTAPMNWNLRLVRTCESIEDTLSPGKHSWPVTLPGSLPEAETRDPAGRWEAVPLVNILEGTVIGVEWR